MRSFEVTIYVEEEEIETFGCKSSWNMRAVLILLYRRYFGKDPAHHYALGGSHCEGQAWEDSASEVPHDVCPFGIRITQANRVLDAFTDALWIIHRAKQPRLAAQRAA